MMRIRASVVDISNEVEPEEAEWARVMKEKRQRMVG
jgi:hypothetical protein